MKAVVLVGGEGTRLRPLTLSTPKQMLPVAEVAMIERVVSHLAAHGVDGVVLSMGYRPDAFLAAFPDDRCAGVPLSYAVEPSPLDTGGAIRFAAVDAGLDTAFLVVNGDVLSDFDVGALVEFHRLCGAEATLGLTPVDDPSPFGVVPVDQDGLVQAFVEKPRRDEAPTNLISAGFYVLEPEVLHRIPEQRRVNVEREVFPAMVADRSLYALPSRGYWTDTGTPQLYLKANLDLLAGLRGSPPARGARRAGEEGWVIGGPVVQAPLRGGALVGDAAFVSRDSRVDRSVVGAGARVEGGTVTSSVLLPGAVVRAGATVEGSILGVGAVVAAGASVTSLSVVGDGVEVEAGALLDGTRLPAA